MSAGRPQDMKWLRRVLLLTQRVIGHGVIDKNKAFQPFGTHAKAYRFRIRFRLFSDRVFRRLKT